MRIELNGIPTEVADGLTITEVIGLVAGTGSPKTGAELRSRSGGRSSRARSGTRRFRLKTTRLRSLPRSRGPGEVYSGTVGARWPDLTSRPIAGSGGFRSLEAMEKRPALSGTEIITVALRRFDPSAQGSVMDVIEKLGLFILPNTAGCYTARDAVRTAKLARGAFGTEWVKLEVIGDDRTLLPDAPNCSGRPRSWSVTASSCCLTPTTTRSSPPGWRRLAALR